MPKYVYAFVLDEKPQDAERVAESLAAAAAYMALGSRLVHGDLEDETLLAAPADSAVASDKQMWYLGKLMRQADAMLRTARGDDRARLETAMAPAGEYLRNKQPIAKALCSQLIDALKGAVEA